MLTFLLVAPLMSASLGTFKQDVCVDIRVLANCSNVDLIEVTNGNNLYVINDAMTNLGGQTFNYTFCSTNYTGEYTYSWNPDCADCSQGDCGNSFLITSNGKEPPTAGVIVLFSLLFFIILGSSVYLIIFSMGHAIQLDFDLKDLSFNFICYFLLLATYYLSTVYMGNLFMEGIFDTFIYIGAVTNIFLPVIYLIISLTIGSYMEKRVKGVDY